MIKTICEGIWKLSLSSNVYFIDFNEKLLIDAGDRADRDKFKLFLSKVVDFEKINKVIFTHLHYDHIGNFDLFPNARFFASEQAIADFNENPFNSILSEDMVEKFNVKLEPLHYLNDFEVISTPGHTRGSICLWYDKEKILFSGDTLFKKGVGRTDLPTSVPQVQKESLIKLLDYPYKILCAGHDY